jgi:uncharacterized metal-binding protein (TIGR02443 family)
VYDAEGSHDGVPCPTCGSEATISWHFAEGFVELECRTCGYRSDAEEIAALERESGELLAGDDPPEAPLPKRPLRA